MKPKSYRWCSKYDAYWEGLDAVFDGKELDDNPYKKGTRSWICWRAGWFGVC